MAIEKKPAGKPAETENETATEVIVDSIETPVELAEKIIVRAAGYEREILSVEKATRVKKAYVGCQLVIAERLLKGEKDSGSQAKVFDILTKKSGMSQATVYRHTREAKAYIDAGVISNKMMVLIEEMEAASPELLEQIGKRIASPKGIAVQEKLGLLPSAAGKKAKKAKPNLPQRWQVLVKQLMELVKKAKKDGAIPATVDADAFLAGFTQKLDEYFAEPKAEDKPEASKEVEA